MTVSISVHYFHFHAIAKPHYYHVNLLLTLIATIACPYFYQTLPHHYTVVKWNSIAKPEFTRLKKPL
jgi:hypothetical protein